jgi:hypothetical protein
MSFPSSKVTILDHHTNRKRQIKKTYGHRRRRHHHHTPFNGGETTSKKTVKGVVNDDVADDETVDDDDADSTNDDFDYEIEDNDLLLQDQDIKKHNKERFEVERKEYRRLKHQKKDSLFYPTLNDPHFGYKIAEKVEFYGTKYDGPIVDIKVEAEKWCNKKFTIMPHQQFVKNFISKQTPYNSLLLYFGLGSGKTCAAIGIAEQTRQYMRLNSFDNPIMIVAKPSIQNNFIKELFDRTKLSKINTKGEKVADNVRNARWNIDNCVGNLLLSEINPNMVVSMKREDIVEYITRIIKKNYVFFGYDKLKNYIDNNIYKKIRESKIKHGKTDNELTEMEIVIIRQLFNNRLVIIDEAHNIRLSDASNISEGTKTSDMLLKIVKYTENMKLLLLSATPMYNKVEEIIWITNLMNLNDGRSIIKISDVFDTKTSNFIEPRGGSAKEGGRELLQRKLIGYVSFIRGENPYIFPYRIYPSVFVPAGGGGGTIRTLKDIKYPQKMTTGKPIRTSDQIKFIDLYINQCGSYQKRGYHAAITPLVNDKTIGTSYSQRYIQKPLQCLNIVYPSEELDNYNPKNAKGVVVNVENIVGDSGLRNVMRYRKVNITGLSGNPVTIANGSNEAKTEFEYLPDVEPIFRPENIGKYSAKIANICRIITQSEGIIMVYSQFLEAGIIPLALALEEMGMTRFGYHNLFKTPPSPALMPSQKYTIISGIAGYSPEKMLDETRETLNSPDNRNGEKIRVLLITKAGAEGLDFANIRQVHIMDSWFNMSRNEQIIGRAVRTRSHCSLPFEKRNVEIYMHTTFEDGEPEFMDMYLYRIAEKKAIQMGQVSRLLKEVSVDCMLNIEQSNMTAERLFEVEKNREIKVELSSKPGTLVAYKIGDKPYTAICDYMADCNYKCSGNSVLPKPTELEYSTYSIENLKTNFEKIEKRVRELFREAYYYKKRNLVSLIQVREEYELEEIYYVLMQFISKKTPLIDENGAARYLTQKGGYYVAIQAELGTNANTDSLTVWDITHPIEDKANSFTIDIGTIITPSPNKQITRNNTGSPITKVSIKKESEFEQLIMNINQMVTIATTNSATLPTIGEKNWFKHLAGVMIFLKTFLVDLTDELISKYAVEHVLDLMGHEDLLLFAEAIYGDTPPLTKLLTGSPNRGRIVAYFNAIKLKNSGGEEAILMVASEKSRTKWSVISIEDDESRFLKELKGVVAEQFLMVSPALKTKAKNQFFIVKGGRLHLHDLSEANPIIMFISGGLFKKKDLENPRAINSNGANMANVENEEIKLHIENYIMKLYPDKEKQKEIKKQLRKYPMYNAGFSKTSLCVIVEIIVRFFNDKVADRIYYLKPVENSYTMGNSVFSVGGA